MLCDFQDLTLGVKRGEAEADGPGSSVPADLCASGAQCRPARTQIPPDASRAASVSQSVCAAQRLSVPLCASPVNRRIPGISSNMDASSLLRRISCASRRCGVCAAQSAAPRQGRRCRRRSASRPPRDPGSSGGISGRREALPLPALQKRIRHTGAQEQPRALRAVERFMARHTDKIRAQLRKAHGQQPADCDASSTNGTPRARHRAAISSTGRIYPKTLDTCVQITALVPGVMARSNAEIVSAGSNSRRPATMISAPRWCSGRRTALCSNRK